MKDTGSRAESVRLRSAEKLSVSDPLITARSVRSELCLAVEYRRVRDDSSVLVQQLHLGFGVLRVYDDTFDRANVDALLGFEMPHALGTEIRINFIDLRTHVYRIVWTFWFTDIAVDAFVGNE